MSELWYELSLMFAAKFGKPLPLGVLEITDEARGLQAKLNNSKADFENIPQFGIFLWLRDWPLGIVDPGGGSLIVAEGARESDLIAWARAKASEFPAVEAPA